MSEDARRPRWGWVVICFVLGAGLVGLALFLEDRWVWQGTMPSVLVNVGTTLSLAGVLVLLEPLFTGRVVRAGREAVREAAAEVEVHLQRRADELSARIDELQTQVDRRMDARARAQDSFVEDLVTPTFTTVTNALTEANRLGALAGGTATVEASADPVGLSLKFWWGTYADGSFDPPGLRLDVEARRLLPGPGGQPVIKLEWKPDEPIDVFAERMNAELMRQGLWDGSDTVDWTLALRNLQDSLRLATTSRRREGATWELQEPLYEMVGSNWALTTAGVESRPANGVLIPESDFPSRSVGSKSADRGRRVDPADWPPPQPDWVSRDEWTAVLDRAQRLFPRSRRLAFSTLLSSWAPFTGTEPDEF
ncbi:MAG: hypothetical protein WBA97_12100 [Actinophytocola sp.]|uniref:hypothetical protein n=1 Tax=Actinophytocola sp. TaxID=1872138 RepID=UPI003C78E617